MAGSWSTKDVASSAHRDLTGHSQGKLPQKEEMEAKWVPGQGHQALHVESVGPAGYSVGMREMQVGAAKASRWFGVGARLCPRSAWHWAPHLLVLDGAMPTSALAHWSDGSLIFPCK